MAYPRACEGCGAQYSRLGATGDLEHVTLASEEGGTRSPWAPQYPGRLLDIGCRLCGAIFRWDYFAATGRDQLGAPVGLLRGPVAGWQPQLAVATRSNRWPLHAPERRAS